MLELLGVEFYSLSSEYDTSFSETTTVRVSS